MTALEYNSLPQIVTDIIDTWDDCTDQYDECARIKYELNQIGWTCDYDLSGTIYDVKEI